MIRALFILCVVFSFSASAYLLTTFYINHVYISEDELNKFYLSIAEDPLFYDPGLDAEFLRASVKELKHKNDLVLSVDRLFRQNLPRKHRDIFPEGWRLWPDEFLFFLPSIHEATAVFLDRPDRDGAERLLALYRSAAEAYKRAIELHISALEAVLTKDPDAARAKTFFLGSGTTPEIVYGDFLLIRKNAEALEQEIALRERCLYGGVCGVPSTMPRAGAVSPIKVPYEPLPEEVLRKHRDFSLSGPYWAETSCFGVDNGGNPLALPFYLDVYFSKNSGSEPFVVPILTNTAFYRDYAEIPDLPISIIHARHGIRFRPQVASNDYLCTDLTYVPELIMKYLATEKGVDNAISARNQLAALPYFIQNTIKTSQPLINYPLYSQRAVHPLNYLIARSAYSVYFGTFSQALWRIAERPRFLLPQNSGLKKSYTDYTALLAGGMTSEEIIELHNIPKLSDLYQDAIHQKILGGEN